jgi:hypothetical protein
MTTVPPCRPPVFSSFRRMKPYQHNAQVCVRASVPACLRACSLQRSVCLQRDAPRYTSSLANHTNPFGSAFVACTGHASISTVTLPSRPSPSPSTLSCSSSMISVASPGELLPLRPDPPAYTPSTSSPRARETALLTRTGVAAALPPREIPYLPPPQRLRLHAARVVIYNGSDYTLRGLSYIIRGAGPDGPGSRSGARTAR